MAHTFQPSPAIPGLGKGGEASEEAPVRVPVRGMGKGAGKQRGRADEKGRPLSRMRPTQAPAPSPFTLHFCLLSPPLQEAKSGKSPLGWGKVDVGFPEKLTNLSGVPQPVFMMQIRHLVAIRGTAPRNPTRHQGTSENPAENSSPHYLLSHQKTWQSCLKVTGIKPRARA